MINKLNERGCQFNSAFLLYYHINVNAKQQLDTQLLYLLLSTDVQRAAKIGLEAVIVQKVNAEADNAHVLLPVVNVIQMFAETAG